MSHRGSQQIWPPPPTTCWGQSECSPCSSCTPPHRGWPSCLLPSQSWLHHEDPLGRPWIWGLLPLPFLGEPRRILPSVQAGIVTQPTARVLRCKVAVALAICHLCLSSFPLSLPALSCSLVQGFQWWEWGGGRVGEAVQKCLPCPLMWGLFPAGTPPPGVLKFCSLAKCFLSSFWLAQALPSDPPMSPPGYGGLGTRPAFGLSFCLLHPSVGSSDP